MFINRKILSAPGSRARSTMTSASWTPTDVLSSFDCLARDLAKEIGRVLSKMDGVHPYIIGSGGDFEQFAEPFINALDKPDGCSIGCLWPFRSPDVTRLGEPIVFFDQEYFEQNEPDPALKKIIIVLQSLVSDPCPMEQTAVRARELAGPHPMILACAAATETTLRTLQERVESVTVLAGTPMNMGGEYHDFDYWSVAAMLDGREVKFAPKTSPWLLDRLDMTPEQRLASDINPSVGPKM